MSVNKYKPHVLVLPEDDANRQLANGFLLGLEQPVPTRQSVWRWRKIVVKKLTQFGRTISFGTMQASLSGYASTYVRSCSSPAKRS